MHKNTTKFCKNAQTCAKNCVQIRKISTAGKNLHRRRHQRHNLFPSLPSVKVEAESILLTVNSFVHQPSQKVALFVLNKGRRRRNRGRGWRRSRSRIRRIHRTKSKSRMRGRRRNMSKSRGRHRRRSRSSKRSKS